MGSACFRERPLTGLKVLDLTRVLVRPVATRLLAGFGAEVLRINPPGWDEPGVVPEMTRQSIHPGLIDVSLDAYG
ncbi:hypothetical protein D2Q93_01420 [Alicyclobacillaceae bacterium I2511]|nr:hypothetical protein D2Q93_01420 [Alicyclobacillaceae bacterium I2511]